MNYKKIILVFVLTGLLIILLNPGLNPLLNDVTKVEVLEELRVNFGMVAETGGIGFSIGKLISIIAIMITLYLISVVTQFVVHFLCFKHKRSLTVSGLFMSVFHTVIVIVGIVWILKVFGIDLAGIFASLGILSLIIGFGAQSLIEDSITGFFIIIEGQYNVGDIIVLDDFRGTVRKISMRTTTFEDDGGNLKIINNSDIRNIQNRSNNLSLAICDIGTSYNENLKVVEEKVQKALPLIYENNKDLFAEVPIYRGVQSLADSAVVIRVTVACSEANYFAATRRLNGEMKLLFDRENIEIPFNQVVVHQAK